MIQQLKLGCAGLWLVMQHQPQINPHSVIRWVKFTEQNENAPTLCAVHFLTRSPTSPQVLLLCKLNRGRGHGCYSPFQSHSSAYTGSTGCSPEEQAKQTNMEINTESFQLKAKETKCSPARVLTSALKVIHS